MFWLKMGISWVLWPQTPGCFTSLIHHLSYSEPSCVYGDDAKTSSFLMDRGKEYWIQPTLPCSKLLHQSICFFIVVTYMMLVFVFVAMKNIYLSIYLCSLLLSSHLSLVYLDYISLYWWKVIIFLSALLCLIAQSRIDYAASCILFKWRF